MGKSQIKIAFSRPFAHSFIQSVVQYFDFNQRHIHVIWRTAKLATIYSFSKTIRKKFDRFTFLNMLMWMILRNTLTFFDDIVQLLFCWLHPIPRSGDVGCLTFTQTTWAVIFWIKLWNLMWWEKGQLQGTKRAKKLHRLKSQSVFCEASQTEWSKPFDFQFRIFDFPI